jgi:hypothetical protein
VALLLNMRKMAALTWLQVQLLPQGLPCGREVTLDLAADTPLLEVKRQLQLATGVPLQHQHVMLSGINQLVMGDKRCGTL